MVVVGAVSATAGYIAPYDTPHAAKNVLFFAVDDMRPNIGRSRIAGVTGADALDNRTRVVRCVAVDEREERKVLRQAAVLGECAHVRGNKVG